MSDTSRSLKAVIYDEILKKIVHNEFAVDELLVENQLEKMFNVSRAPVREALIELCGANIIRNIPRAGYQIIRISEKDIRDALQYRLILETEGLIIGYPKLTKKNIEELKILAVESDDLRNLGVETDAVSEKMKLNNEFHIAINKISGNSLITKALEDNLDMLWRGLVQIMIHENKMPLPEATYHSRIVKALEEGNLDVALDNLKSDILVYSNLGPVL
jgi:DNA-binding GntR family transcriptional regulator